MILFNSNHDPQRQREYMDVVRRYRVDGVLITPTFRDMAIWQECVGKLDVPAVVITRHAKDLDSVYLDHEEAARLVARHLAERNYEQFLFIGKRTDTKYKGFSEALKTMGLCPTGEVRYFECEDDGEFLRDLKKHLDQAEGRTGIFANNDLWALRTLRALRELNISVPEKAGVIGFDNISMGRYFYPSLSSVSQPIAQMADKAVSRLFYRIDHPDEPKLLDLPMQAALVQREST